MSIVVENAEEFHRLCKKVVSESMLRLKPEQEETVIRLMMTCIEVGYNLAKFNKAEVEV